MVRVVLNRFRSLGNVMFDQILHFPDEIQVEDGGVAVGHHFE